MLRRNQGRGAQQVAPKGCPRTGDARPRAPLLPKLTSSERRAGRGAGTSEDSRTLRACSSWWPEQDTEPGVGSESPATRLPALRTATPRAAQNRAALKSLQLPLLLSTGGSRRSASPRPQPGQGEDPRRGVAREAPDSLGALLGEFLPSRFREFLQQLQRKCAEQPEPQKTLAPQYPKCLSDYSSGSAQCHSCPFLPDLWGQPPHFKDNFKKTLLHQIPSLGHLRGDLSQFTTVRNTNRVRGTQAPKGKAALTQSPSGEGSGLRRRCCPFRVRFADETLQDSALRYWERSCAVPPNVESRVTPLPAVSEKVFGSVRKWLDSLPKGVHPRAKDEARASSSCWDCPHLLPQELRGYCSDNAPMKSSLPVTPRATSQGWRRDFKSSLDALNILDQEAFLPNLMLQSILKRGRPKGYELFLPSTIRQQTPR